MFSSRDRSRGPLDGDQRGEGVDGGDGNGKHGDPGLGFVGLVGCFGDIEDAEADRECSGDDQERAARLDRRRGSERDRGEDSSDLPASLVRSPTLITLTGAVWGGRRPRVVSARAVVVAALIGSAIGCELMV